LLWDVDLQIVERRVDATKNQDPQLSFACIIFVCFFFFSTFRQKWHPFLKRVAAQEPFWKRLAPQRPPEALKASFFVIFMHSGSIFREFET